MKPLQIYVKTLNFTFYKLLFGLLNLILCVLTLFICLFIGSKINSEYSLVIAFIVWFILFLCIYNFLNHYIGYIIKAGHIAIISKAVYEGSIPNNSIPYAKQIIKKRFVLTNVYFAIDRLIKGAVSQIQRLTSHLDDLGNIVPGMSIITSILDIFIGLVLNYVDDCCLGYAFMKEEEDAFKASLDGVVLYFQNWKELLKNSAKITITLILLVILLCIIPIFLCILVFSFINDSEIMLYIGIACGFLIALIFKFAFIDPYILIKIMTNYMSYAKDASVQIDLYEKLSNQSKSFKKLAKKAEINV
ncbi:MAG: hypothetical protein Q4F88_05215 [Eubacteriales bacterium]|nr:hypothetical protein [Eubacteriales bacterium]